MGNIVGSLGHLVFLETIQLLWKHKASTIGQQMAMAMCQQNFIYSNQLSLTQEL